MTEAPEIGWTPEDHEHLRALIAAESLLAFRACDELQAAATARIKPWSGRAQIPDEPEFTADQLISLEFARATKTFEAVLLLCRDGYGQQGAMLNRSLFEGMAVAHWIHEHAAEAEQRAKESLRFGSHLAAVLIDEFGWADEVDAEELVAARLEGETLETLEKKFGPFGDRMWTGHRNLPALLAEITGQWDDGGDQLLSFFKVVNRDNNQQLHSTMVALTSAFSRHVEGGTNLWIGASNVHIGEALHGAYWTYGQTLTLVAERFDLADRDGLGPLIEHGGFGLHPLVEAGVSDVGRNDPCPCRSGKKYKECHLEQIEAVQRVKRRTRDQ